MTTFVICDSCGQLRAKADMRGPRCRFAPCGLPRLASQPLPPGYAVTPPADALERMLKQVRERNG